MDGQTLSEDRRELVRELGRVRERGIIRVESPNADLRRREFPLLRSAASRFDASNKSFSNKLLNLIQRAIHDIPPGVARTAALRLYGLDVDPTFPRPTQWRNEARKMFPQLGADDWRKGMELEILGLVASNIMAILQPTNNSRADTASIDNSSTLFSPHVRSVGNSHASSPYDRTRPIFIQYLNPEILACYGYAPPKANVPIILEDAYHATRLAVLATDSHLVMPASYLFEVPSIPVFLENLRDLIALGQVNYCSPTKDTSVYKQHKSIEYRSDRLNPYIANTSPTVVTELGWSPRQNVSTAQDIASSWKAGLDEDGALRSVLANMAPRWDRTNGQLDERLADVPDKLDGQAFVSRFVSKAIPMTLTPGELLFISFFLSKVYLESYLADLDAMILHDLRMGELSCGLSSQGSAMKDRVVSARSLDLALHWLGLYCYVHRAASWVDLVDLRTVPEFGMIAVATQGAGHIEQLRRAITRARRHLPEGKAVNTLSDAKALVEVVAAHIF